MQASNEGLMNQLLAHTFIEPVVLKRPVSPESVTQPSVRKGHRKPDEQSGSQAVRLRDLLMRDDLIALRR